MAREIKLGIFALVTIIGAIWGYKFVVGKNLFQTINTYRVEYDNVDGLDISAPVKVNGFKIGKVADIKLNPANVQSMIVTLEVDDDFSFPKDTRAVLEGGQLMGGKEISIDFDQVCTSDCLQSGDMMIGYKQGFIEGLVGVDDINTYSDVLKNSVAEAIDTLNTKLADPNDQSPINLTVRDMQATMQHMASMTKSMDQLMKVSSNNLNKTIANMNVISKSLADGNEEITAMMANVATITSQLKNADVSKTLGKTNVAIDSTVVLLEQVTQTMEMASQTFAKFNDVLAKVDDGKGSLSKLLNDQQLYDNLEMTSKNMGLLLQDMRLNPKRYVSISVFGKSAKQYVKPEDDPAYQEPTPKQ